MASEFVRVCRRLCLLDLAALNSDYVHYLIAAQMSEHDEGGRRGCGSRTDGAHEIGSGYNPLDSFFPFDPYLLQASSKYITPLYVNWSDVVGDEEESEEEDEEDSDELDLSDSLSSLSMSIESHGSFDASTPLSMMKKPREKGDAKEAVPRQRKLSVSMFYEEGSMEVQETHAFESNPLSYNNTEEEDDKDFQKLSFTHTRKMSDAGGW